MLAQSAMELVGRCYERNQRLFTLDDLKQEFITYVFEIYQEEVVAAYGLEAFYEHLESLQLTNCRKDFDTAVEEWYLVQYGSVSEQTGYHDVLFALVKEAIAVYQPSTREELIRDVTRLLTSPAGFMAKWRNEKQRTIGMYFRHLMKLGIRTYADIEALIDMWLIEHPNAFDERLQRLLSKPNRRGRPNNLELSILFEKVYELKPELTRQEKERIRKIYYYHRKNLTTLAMVEKFKNYVMMKSPLNNQNGMIQHLAGRLDYV
jgi:hypothetical protein